MLIYPSLIYSDGNIREFFQEYLSFHTVLFHNLVVFAFVLILSLDLPMSMGKGSVKAISIFMLVFSVVAAVMSQLLKTNYTNMYQCNIPVFEEIRLSLQPVLGYWVTQGLYVSILTCPAHPLRADVLRAHQAGTPAQKSCCISISLPAYVQGAFLLTASVSFVTIRKKEGSLWIKWIRTPCPPRIS